MSKDNDWSSISFSSNKKKKWKNKFEKVENDIDEKITKKD